MRTSDQIDKIAEALAKAQGAMANPEKNQKAVIPHKNGGGSHEYNYADLPITIDTARKALADNGLSHTFGIIEAVDHALCCYRLMHSSGQWMESSLRLPESDNIKSFAANLTYLRRYLFTALIGVAAEDDLDSEPEKGATYGARIKPAQAIKPPVSSASNPAAKPSPVKPAVAHTGPAGVSLGQLAGMFKLAKEKLWSTDNVAEYLGAAFQLKGTNAMTQPQLDLFTRILETMIFEDAMQEFRQPQFDPNFADDGKLG